MGQKLVVGPFNRGLRNDVTPFNIDNDSFPILINAYQWRGRVKRKRGTSLLTRLQRYFNSLISSYNPGSTTITLSSGAGNLLTGFTTLQSNASIVPGTVTINDVTSSKTYTDPTGNGVLVGSPSGSGTINYATGAFTIVGGASDVVNAIFSYYPDLPVMGLRDFISINTQFPGTLGFDTTYSYNITTSAPYTSYNVNYYKNPTNGSYAGYTAKPSPTPFIWNGKNYQQFWTTNYEGALWATNGIQVPFSITNIGMQFNPIVTVTVTAGGPPAIVNLQITGHGLSVGDFLFINEVVTTTGINFQTGYVTTVVDANNVTVEFPNATIAGNGTGGIAQYLTNNANASIDCLRWYDGDPTNGSLVNPVLNGHLGWVNFMPPLSSSNFSIAQLPAAQYYLVGAKMVVPFKDRLLFLGAVVQTSTGNPIYLKDTIVYSQNGTPYYTASFTGSVTSAATTYNPVLVPVNQTATPNAYFGDVTGFGGFVSAGIDQDISSVGPNRDVLIVGFNRLQTKLIYSGNDIVPFNFFIVNSELGSGSVFSSVIMDEGMMTRGSRGYVITSQTGAQRFDLEIPDEIFESSLMNNGTERVCAQRDFINEWVYFTYPINTNNYIYPTQTLQYNYRDNSWGIFNESYTAYGQFRASSGYTWATIGTKFPTWADWNEPWDAGSSSLLQPKVIAGNQQGFVLLRDVGTGEGTSLYIQAISGSTITSPDHSLNSNDYIVISGCLGTVGSAVNGNVFSVTTIDENTFSLNPPIAPGLTYTGGGLIQRMYVPFIQTKQFATNWSMARKTRIGAQQYLFTTTSGSQVTLLIYLSQDASNPYNDLEFPYTDGIVPAPSENNSLVYSAILYTCPESTNLGLTPANINLNMVTATSQSQIWHRMNTSLIGDTVQIGFTLSDAQMRDINRIMQFAEIELHGFILDLNPSMLLA